MSEGASPHDWIGYLQPVGLVVAPAALTRIGAWPTPQTAADGSAVAAASAGDDRWTFFRDILGWVPDRVAGAPGGPTLPDALRIAFPEQDPDRAKTRRHGANLAFFSTGQIGRR